MTRKFFSAVCLIGGVFLLGGCEQSPIRHTDGTHSQRSFSINNVAKSESDMVAELAQREVIAGVRVLAEKLYRRNPQEYRKAGHASAGIAAAHLIDQTRHWQRAPMARADWHHSFKLAFDPEYPGDRVEVLVTALTVMLMSSYNHRMQFYLTDQLDPQKLYNSARNIEVAVWKLSQSRYPDGRPLLVTNSLDAEAVNLSFEREFGKLIARQDLMALIVEDRSNRGIARALQSTASFIFLPI